MKVLSIILTIALLCVMGWLIVDSRSEAKGAKNQLDLLRRQQAGTATPGDTNRLAALEQELVAQQMKTPAPAPTSVPAPIASAPPAPRAYIPPPSVTIAPSSVPAPVPATTGSTPKVTAAIEAANAAPIPATPRQRLIAAAPALAEVQEYQKDYGFVVITAGAGRKIEAGMGFAIRRGSAIIARVKVTEVENATAVANVDSRSVPPGILIEIGDEVIQDLPPES